MSYKEQIEGIIETIYKRQSYILDNEVKQVLLDDAQHKLISAPAGGTKTTLTQLMVNLLKLDFMINGVRHNQKITDKKDRVPTLISKSRILCLVYNAHNAEDIQTVHAKFYNLLTQLKITSSSPAQINYVEPGVYATTLHAYAKKLVEDNLAVLKLRSFELSKDEIIASQFRGAVNSVMKESSLTVNSNMISDAKRLYDLYVGLKLYETPIEQPLTDSVQFELALQNTQIPPRYLRKIFDAYDKRKKALKINEFSDMLRRADEILKIPEIREHYNSFFDIIVADEVQDFTPLMFSIYKALVGKKTRTITVG
ncbi:UvrD-helicase domain-containing protein, partial [Lysinibacillus xylanilyticus]|uniref:UvrD-helicase domain-containing protein n=1 Tax=Lysinibacillus xylanilyticus TaxID=582475 RepID=UPI0036DCB075